MNYLNARSPQVQALQGGATLVLVPIAQQPVIRDGAFGFRKLHSSRGILTQWLSSRAALVDSLKRHAPYRVGQRVGAREAWAIKECGKLVSIASTAWPKGFPVDRLEYIADLNGAYTWNKRPARTMPDWAIRLWFEVSARRVIKCSEISEEDALKAGCRPSSPATDDEIDELPTDLLELQSYLGGGNFTAKFNFIQMWDEMYPRHPWETSWAFGFEGKVSK